MIKTEIDIDWPKGSYIQDVSIVFKNTQNTTAIDFGTNTIHIKLDAVTSSVLKGNIMSYKKIGTSTDGVGKVFKNIPIPIIKCCTGIHTESLQLCPAFKNPDSIENEDFTIKNPRFPELSFSYGYITCSSNGL